MLSRIFSQIYEVVVLLEIKQQEFYAELTTYRFGTVYISEICPLEYRFILADT